MKQFVGIIIFSLMISVGIYAQESSSELKQLRKEINLPDTSQIFVDESKDFPKGQTIKIYLSIKHNKKFAKDFVKWIDDWNKNNTDNKLEMVDKISDADVVAAQFRYGIGKYVPEERLTISTSKIPKDEKFIGQGLGNSKVRAEKGYVKLDQPLYSYLLTRNDNGTWTVNFSYVDEAFDYQKTFPEVRLQGVIEDKMKDR